MYNTKMQVTMRQFHSTINKVNSHYHYNRHKLYQLTGQISYSEQIPLEIQNAVELSTQTVTILDHYEQ